MSAHNGVVFGIQHFSIHDGPGVRTTVFLKGCNLRCAWCHNPESLDPRVEIAVNTERCVGCGACASACPAKLHRATASGIEHVHGPSRCLGCGKCEAACPTGAIHRMGVPMSVGEVMAQVRLDRRFYAEDGGLTVTGGEPMAQYAFLAALAKAAHDEGIGVCIETNGSYPWSQYAALLPFLSSVLVDWKLTDPGAHRRWVGADNAAIRENIGRFAESGLDVVLRCPIIPGVNDDDGHFRGIAELTRLYPAIRGAELMPYHRLGIPKAEQLGWRKAEIVRFDVPTPGQIDAWKSRIIEMGGRLLP